MPVAPPRGERGLKHGLIGDDEVFDYGRSPSWGAWIETAITSAATAAHICRSPSWGAWIEIKTKVERAENARVAPPRGERGLKSFLSFNNSCLCMSLPLVGSVD